MVQPFFNVESSCKLSFSNVPDSSGTVIISKVGREAGMSSLVRPDDNVFVRSYFSDSPPSSKLLESVADAAGRLSLIGDDVSVVLVLESCAFVESIFLMSMDCKALRGGKGTFLPLVILLSLLPLPL